MPVVLVCQGLLYKQSGRWSEILEHAGFEIRFPTPGGRTLYEAELIENIAGVDATIASGEPYNARVFDAAPQLRVISRTGVGYDAVDVAEATRRGVLVAITPGTNQEAVAEHAFALMLGLVKHLMTNHATVASGAYARMLPGALRGKTLGIVGMGRIGQAVERRAHAFNMRVLAYDPGLAIGCPPDGRQVVCLEELLAESDIVTLHAPLVPETRHLIRDETIARMKPGAILINTSRGGLVNEQALAAALQSGQLAMAGLDVTEREPPVGSPLLGLPNVLLSPHIAGVDEQAMADMAAMAAQSIVDILAGHVPMDRVVNA